MLGGTSTAESKGTLQTSLTSFSEQGKSLVSRGDYAKATTVFEQGRREANRLGSFQGELLFLTYLGNTANAQHHFEAAIESYLKARDLAEQGGDWSMLAVIESNIAGMYLAQGALDEATWAMEGVDEALRRSGEKTPQLAAIRMLQAKVRSGNGDTEGALALFREAVEAADEAGDDAMLCRALDLLGYELLVADRLDEADRVLVEAFRRRALLDPPVPDVTYLNLGLLRLRQGDIRSAATLVDRAFEAVDARTQMVQSWAPYLARAQVRMSSGNPDGSLEDLEYALSIVQTQRLALLPAHSVRAGARAGLEEVYIAFVEAAARSYFATGSEEAARRAFEVAEQHRAIALRETLEEAALLRERLPVEYWELLGQVSDAEQMLMREERDDIHLRLDQLEARLHEIEIQTGIGSRGPRAILSTAALHPASTETLEAALGESEVLFGFQLGDEASYLWSLTTEGLEMYCLSPRRRIAELALEFRDAVVRSSIPATRERGAALSQLLFGQVSERVLAKPDWILLPDRELFEVPFAALTSPAGQGHDEFLVESHSLRILPSALMLLDEPGQAWVGPFLGVGDPIYNTADPRWKPKRDRETSRLGSAGSPRTDGGVVELNRLVGSASEVRLSAQAFGGTQPPTVLLGENATVSELRSALAEHPSVIHLATHIVGSLDADGDELIAFSLSDDGRNQLLGTHTVANWESDPLLVVMSGCRSGGGTVLPGEGLLGLTRAWLRAGARNVAATLWPANDAQGELLGRMYSYLNDQRPVQLAPAKALQLAQIDMLRSQEWGGRPDYWASYFVVSRE